ncbi:MAG TPA: HD-GYP domain-containing protein [Methylomirabilota bacterium]|nr:HD-GYP domain-containing protein [Methylomirabilota bacterium]
MKAVHALVNGAARKSCHPTPEASGPERGPRPFGIQGLLRIAELSSKGTDTRAFTSAVLDSALRSLHAEAALMIARGPGADLVRRQTGAAPVVRRLLSHVHGMVSASADDPLTWMGEERGLAVLGAVIPEMGQAQLVLCVGRDPQGNGFLRREKELLLGYAQTSALVIERIRLQETLERQRADVATAFATALASRDNYLQGHSTRVAIYVEEVARVMGLPAAEVRVARRAGILHDLGKLSTPDCILLKPSALTEAEYADIKLHPTIAAALLEPYGSLAPEAEAVKRHHEWYDGQGYPDGLAGAEIAPAARIVSVADAFDAMTSDRPYRRPLPFEVAREEIRQGAGSQFDPTVAEAWLSIPDDRLAPISRHAADTGRESMFRLLTSEVKAGVPACQP